VQVTLVGYYGPKPGELSELIRGCKDKVAGRLLSRFHPYDIEQVHATVIGLEGDRVGEGTLNRNFLELRQQRRPMNFEEFLVSLKSSAKLPMQIRIGGFRPHEKYPFTSRGQHPYFRSFSVRGEIAVAMGWPIKKEPQKEDEYPESLHELRLELQQANVLHKYHGHPVDDKDNDFFFVLGRVDREHISDMVIQELEESLRAYLAGLRPIFVPLSKERLSVVGYLDPQLPRATSVPFSLTDERLDAARILQLYEG
jgi:hypothetical protein